MEVAKILEEKPKAKIYGLIGNINISTNHENYSIVTEYKFPNTVKEYLNSKKDIASLKMVMLNETILNKTSRELSNMDIKKINLAYALIQNKEYIILDYFEKGLNYSELEYFKRLFKKLALDYQKTILIFTNDITLLWNICEEIFIIDNLENINEIKKENYLKVLDYIDKPQIIRMIDLIKAKNIKIEYYKNTLDLLKAIYRIKEKK